MNFEKLTKDNIMLFAMQHYDNPQCSSMDDFHEDYMRVKYLKRLFKKYKEGGELKERLILNHIVIFNNMFGPVGSARILFYEIDDSFHDVLKPFLIFLNIISDSGKIDDIETTDITMDQNVIKILREL